MGSETATADHGEYRVLTRHWPAESSWARMLIVHGLGEHSGRYERTGALFADAGIDTWSFDLYGHGDSEGRRAHVDDFSVYRESVEERLSAVRALGGPTVLLGHSLGGLIALDYVLADHPAPDLLVLSSPGLSGGKAWQRVLAPLLARVIPTLAVPAAITGEQLSRDPEVGERYFADPLVLTKATAKLGAEIFAAGDRVRDRLDRLEIPTLVIHGGVDTVVPAKHSAVFEQHPKVERVLYPKLRHECFNEPEGPEVVGEVTEWLASRLKGQAS
jgi:alpha-beta hydrolase superfamily lysophospholipase